MIAESLEAGASASKVAQRYGVNANLLFTWRRQEARAAASGEAESVKLLTVRVAEAEAPAAAPVAASGPAGGWRSFLAAESGSLSAWTSTRRRWRAWSER
jgi:transposase-like protein